MTLQIKGLGTVDLADYTSCKFYLVFMCAVVGNQSYIPHA